MPGPDSRGSTLRHRPAFTDFIALNPASPACYAMSPAGGIPAGSVALREFRMFLMALSLRY